MKKLDKYGYWLMLSDYDMDTVDVLVTGKRWVYVAYICQQAMERLLKGIYVYYNDVEAPKTHNINFLFGKLCERENFPECRTRAEFEAGRDECEDFLIDVMFYHITDYPFSYKNIMNRFIDEPSALELVERTRRMNAWLRSFQPAAKESEAK